MTVKCILLTPPGQMKDILWQLITQNYNLIKKKQLPCLTCCHQYCSRSRLQIRLSDNSEAVEQPPCWFALWWSWKKYWVVVRGPEFRSWLCSLKCIWFHVGHLRAESPVPRVQNKENDPFPSPADLARLLWSSEDAKNLKLLKKKKKSPGRMEGDNIILFIF